MGTNLKNQNSFLEEIKSKYKSGNACYHSVQNFVSSIVSKNVILLVAFYGCATLSLTLREERRLRVFENMVLRRIFGPKREMLTGEWRKLHTEELTDLYSPHIRLIKS